MAAVAPGGRAGKLRSTTVRRVPYWMEWGNSGKGRIKLLPADRTHNAQLVDENGVAEPYYQSKGLVPLHLLPKTHEAHKAFDTLCENAVKRANASSEALPAWVPPSYADAA